MSKKVVITKEQAEAIEHLRSQEYYAKSDERIISIHASTKVPWTHTTKAGGLNSMTLLNLVDALRIGYEVEANFNDSKYFVNKFGNIGCLYETKEPHVYWSNGSITLKEFVKKNFLEGLTRHATEDEIKKYDERQLWRKIDRKVGEFKDGDRGQTRCGKYVLSPETMRDLYEDGELRGFYPIESFVEFKEE